MHSFRIVFCQKIPYQNIRYGILNLHANINYFESISTVAVSNPSDVAVSFIFPAFAEL